MQTYKYNPEHREVLDLKIKLILERFDFARVLQTMIALKWKYSDSDEYPTIKHLKEIAKMLMENAMMETGHCSTGGFTAKIINEKTVYLYFAVETTVE